MNKITRRTAIGLAVSAALAPELGRGQQACIVLSNGKLLAVGANVLCGILPSFDFYISPTGDDILGAGTLASPWSITALGTLANRSTSACKWSTYGGKRVGLLPGTYTYGTANGVQTTLYSLAMNPPVYGPGCVLLLNGGTSVSSTVIGASTTAGLAYTAPYGRPTAIIDNGNSGVPPLYEMTLIGQNEGGTNGGSLPPNYGYITLDGLGLRNFCHHGAQFGDNAHAGVQGYLVKNCEIYNGYGFSDDNNDGVSFDTSAGGQVQNTWVHDVYSVNSTYYCQFVASFAGNQMTVTAVNFGTLNYVSTTPFIYGPGLPAGLTVTAQPGTPGGVGVYTLSASVGTIGSQTCTAGYITSVTPWGGYASLNANTGVPGTQWTNCTIQRAGHIGSKASYQTMVFRYSYVETGNFGSYPNLVGGGSFGELFFSTPSGGQSILDHCILVGNVNTYNAGETGSIANEGALQVSNTTFYSPSGAYIGEPLMWFNNNNATSPLGTSNAFNNLFYTPNTPSGYLGLLSALAAPQGMTQDYNGYLNSTAIFSTATSGAGATPEGLSAWQTATSLDAHSILLTSSPFTGTPASGLPASFAISGPATTAGKTGGALGAIDGTVSSLGYPVGCTFGTALCIGTAPMPVGTTGMAYSYQLYCAGGSGGGYTWSVVSDTGSGLTLSGSGLFSGSSPATATIVVQVTDSASNVTQQTFYFTVVA